jgi:hypothetical protein
LDGDAFFFSSSSFIKSSVKALQQRGVQAWV